MNTAELFLYSGFGGVTHHKRLNCQSCLELLLPHIKECRRTKRSLTVAAEVRLPNGVTVKIGSVDGDIDLSEKRPFIGSSRKWLGFIPAPSVTTPHPDSSDFAIHRVVAKAFGPGGA